MKHLLWLALFALLPASLRSQQSTNTRDLMMRAIRAYQGLDFDIAAALLRRVLASDPPPDDATRVRALTYLGAAEHYRGQADSAEAAFQRLIVLAPSAAPDTLVFPPEVTRVYDDVLSRIRVVTVLVPPPAPVDTTPSQPAALAPLPPPPPPPPPPPLPAPELPTTGAFTVTAAGVMANVRAQSSGGLPLASGMVPGMSASVRYRRWELGVRYLQGSLQSRDLVEGAAALRFGATPWLTLHAGPQIRRYDMPSGAERWVTWQVGARADGLMVGPVSTHAVLWRGLGLSVNVPPGTGSAAGGEVGLRVDAPGPLWFGLAYAIDRASLAGGGRRETVEAITLSAGLRRP